MKRRFLLKFGLLLVLGAIINVAVAWGFAIFIEPHLANPTTCGSFSGTGMWKLVVYSGHGAECYSSVWSENQFEPASLQTPNRDPALMSPRWSEPHIEPASWISQTKLDVRLGQASGWPNLSMCIYRNCIYRNGTLLASTVSQGAAIGSGMVNVQFSTQRVLPFGVIGRGFAINTIFYAASCWVLFVMWGALRDYLKTLNLADRGFVQDARQRSQGWPEPSDGSARCRRFGGVRNGCGTRSSRPC